MTNVVSAGLLFAASLHDRMVARSEQVAVRVATRPLHAEGRGLASYDLDDLQQPCELRAGRLTRCTDTELVQAFACWQRSQRARATSYTSMRPYYASTERLGRFS
ncbi:UNVERIFIED_CONTAM: hypothetical protein Sradi_2069100 [Sesamum radiatum]|uniref:Uncharacterized protein n=1 Tax=Sesamum radiatum TaxID=300843 RepID=A0AAW2TJE3_SESRA